MRDQFEMSDARDGVGETQNVVVDGVGRQTAEPDNGGGLLLGRRRTDNWNWRMMLVILVVLLLMMMMMESERGRIDKGGLKMFERIVGIERITIEMQILKIKLKLKSVNKQRLI